MVSALQLQTFLAEISASYTHSSTPQYIQSQSHFLGHVQRSFSKPAIWDITSLDQVQISNLPHFLMLQINLGYQTSFSTIFVNKIIYFNYYLAMKKPYGLLKNNFQLDPGINEAVRNILAKPREQISPASNLFIQRARIYSRNPFVASSLLQEI